MQERQVTLEGEALPIGQPFMVLATQNPIEQEGTYPCQKPSWTGSCSRLRMDYPDAQQELDMVREVTRSSRADMLDVQPLRTVLQAEDVLQLQQIASELALDERVLDYAVRLARATRSWPGLAIGAGPRASIALVRGARARALLRGGQFVTPDDVKSCALAVLRHRVRIAAELDIDRLEVEPGTQTVTRPDCQLPGNESPMKPTRLLSAWLGVLLGLSILLGTATALQFKVPPPCRSVAWGLLLALLLLALLRRRATAPSTVASSASAYARQPGAGSLEARYVWPWNMTPRRPLTRSRCSITYPMG